MPIIHLAREVRTTPTAYRAAFRGEGGRADRRESFPPTRAHAEDSGPAAAVPPGC